MKLDEDDGYKQRTRARNLADKRRGKQSRTRPLQSPYDPKIPSAPLFPDVDISHLHLIILWSQGILWGN